MVHGILKLWFFPLVRGIFVRKVSGLENLPKKGPFLIVVNHDSYIDPVIMSSVLVPKLNKKIRYIAWFKIFKWWSSSFLRLGGAIEQDHSTMKAVEALKRGDIVALFPEGERTRNGKIAKIKHTGAAVIAILSGAKIVPVAIKGTYELWSRHRKYPKFNKIVEIKVGRPMRLRYKKLPSRSVMLSELNKVMKKIDVMKKSQ